MAHNEEIANKTKSSLLLTGLLNEPMIGLFSILPFILRKNLHASLFQIALFTMLRPIMAVFSFYWSYDLTWKIGRLRSNLTGAWLLSRLPFLLIPFCQNIWFIIFASGLYCLFYRAGTPALMEILKLNLQKNDREKLFTISSVLNFSLSIFIGLFIGKLFDLYPNSWKMLFFISSVFGIISAFIQWQVPIRGENNWPHPSIMSPRISLKYRLIQPWKDSYLLLKNRPDFLHFQKGFMAGGIGLMLMAPALIFYYADILKLTYVDLSISRLMCMGVGFVLFSPLWKKALSLLSIERLTSLLCLGFGLFPIFILLAQLHISWLYFAFIIYGMTQAGSHLIWNLSGPSFAGKEKSHLFSTVNILTVGIRGLIAPLIGGFLCLLTGPIFVIILGMLFCFYGHYIMLKKKEPLHQPNN